MGQIKINYISELKSGELLVIRGGYSHVGGKSIRHHLRMYNADTNVLCSTQDTIEVFFDPEKRTSAEVRFSGSKNTSIVSWVEHSTLVSALYMRRW